MILTNKQKSDVITAVKKSLDRIDVEVSIEIKPSTQKAIHIETITVKSLVFPAPAKKRLRYIDKI